MLVSIENEALSVTVDTLGAQLRSILGKNGCEYLWQGDPAYWAKQAPVLFPVIGRLEEKKHRVGEREYPMGIHGFAAGSEFAVSDHRAASLTLTLQQSSETLSVYPFAFSLEITYRLTGSTLEAVHRVTNRSGEIMAFAIGGHPGFRVPLEEGLAFEDYCLEFSEVCAPERIGFTADTVLVSGKTEPYPLEDGRRIRLRHDLFDDDAIILQNTSRQVTLKSSGGSRSVTVAYSDMAYLGFWHMPKRDAPYVCIEPWSALPGRSGIIEDFAKRPDFTKLAPGQSCENTFTVSIA